jgi:predicted outer membrane repeat protein
MKSLLSTLFSMFLFLNIGWSQVIYVYNADEWELSNAISNANNGDTIMFDLPSYPASINIMSGYMIANKSISIIGPQNASVTLEGYADQFMGTQIFYLDNNAEIELKNLTITRQSGGGNNSGQQGLIYNGATLHINNCLLYNVIDTSSQGSVIFNAWAGNLSIKNSTFSGNYGGQGGAIYSAGNLDIESCTFYENHAANVGGGVFWHANGGYFNSKNSIYYNSTCYKYSNIINSLGYNLSNDGSYGFNACTDFNNVSSLFLNQLQDNGGPTHTQVSFP